MTLTFSFTDTATGRAIQVETTREEGKFTGNVELPGGEYLLEAVLETGDREEREVLSETFSISPVDIAADIQQNSRSIGWYNDSQGHQILEENLFVFCNPGKWPARKLTSLEMVVYVNGEKMDSISFDVEDPENWPNSYTTERVMDDPNWQPEVMTPMEGGYMFVSRYRLDLTQLGWERQNDTLSIDLLAEDTMGIRYILKGYRGESPTTSSTSAGALEVDREFYGLEPDE